MDIAAGVAGGIAGKLAEYIVDPIVRRCPFKNLWEYRSNVENLNIEVNKLEEKRVSVQGLTNAGVEPLPDVKVWQDKATNILDEVSGLISEDNPGQQSVKCCQGCTYSNLKEWYQHRNNIARKLKDVDQHLQEAAKSTNSWKYKSSVENLKKGVEKLKAKRDGVKRLIKVGHEPSPDVKLWQDEVNKIINESSGLINANNQEDQDNVARKVRDVAQLLQEAREFREVATISEETVYKNNLENLEKEVKKLVAEKDRVQQLIKEGEEPLPNVQVWQDKVDSIVNVVSGLTNQHNPQSQHDVAQMLNDVAELLQEARDFREVSTIPEEKLYKINVENLKKQVETLKLKREGVQCLIKVGDEPLPQVKVWQDKVKKIVDEVSGLTSEHNPDQQNNLAQMLTEVAQLLQEEAQFRDVSYRPPLEPTYPQPSIQLEASESRRSILKDIIAKLRNADVNMVGIYGMGGVGKTTLAKKVETQALQDELFDKTVFVEVSQSPDIRSIQGVIADHLNLQFEEESVAGRARRLCDVLLEEKKILIILDNLWKGIKLREEIGIPFGKDCTGLKLLLTARRQDVLTKWMDSQHNFHVKALSEADAWILFKNIAGPCVDHPHLKSTATEVAKKCGGMPLAIVAVATALKDTEAKEEWKDALRSLNNPSSESFEGITEEVYNSIKLSYDYLHGKLKKIFLLCSRMGHTHDASVHDLFKYGLGLGFFDEFDTMEDALCNVHTSVNHLKAASLLLDAPTPAYERFAIHDVICDVARSIASKDQHVFTVIDDHVPRSLTNENTLKRCTSITLYDIGKLPKDLELACPNLKFLNVKSKFSYLTIPDNFFKGISSLQVLHLIQIALRPLPTSLSCLVNLRALCLDHCIIGDVVIIGNMKKLEILSFDGSDIERLPKEVCQLTKLRRLDLKNCCNPIVIPSKVMSCLTGIEALYMSNTSIQWGVARSNIGGSNVSIDELKHWHRLTKFEMYIPKAKMIRGVFSSELEKYKLFIGDKKRWVGNFLHKPSTILKLDLDTKEDWNTSLLQEVEELELKGEVVDATNLLDDLDGHGFPQLMYLDVSNNKHGVCIVNSVSCAALPSLESLTVMFMVNLEKICKNPLGAGSILNLKSIHVWNCYKLSNIFCLFSLFRVLPNLIDLEVYDCQNMGKIFAIEDQDEGNSIEVVHDIEFSRLCHLTLKCLPKLEGFCCKAKTASSSLFNEKVVMPKLKDLEVSGIHHVEQIWHSLLPTLSACVQNLTHLIVYGCANLKELFSSSTVITKEMREKEKKDTILFPKLNSLVMGDLTKLTRLCSGYYIAFPSLKVFMIEGCPHLEAFIFDETVQVPNLKEMKIFFMHNLKMIWHNKLTEDSFSKLISLEVRECKKLLTVFPSSMCGRLSSLESLNIADCYSLEQICDLQGINSEKHDHDPFVNLQELNVLKCPSLKYFFAALNVAKEGVVGKEVPVKFVFPNLTTLKLHHLSEFKTFYASKHTVEGPILKKAELCLFLVQQVFPCLEELKLTGKNIMTMWQAQVPLGINQRFQNLKRLTLTGDLYNEIFSYGNVQTPLPKMKTLLLQYVGDLKHMWEEDSQLDLIFQNFEVLMVETCNGLINLMLPSSSFQNLTILNVWDCDSLETIVLSSVAKSLVKLETMRISCCPKITEVIQNQGDVTEEKIIFSNLKTLELIGMPNLTSFCSCNFTLEFPSLGELHVWDCKNIETFSWGDLIMPMLQEVMIDDESFKLCSDTNLNTIIRQFHEISTQYFGKGTMIYLGSSSQHME